jgi:hypothetical protein
MTAERNPYRRRDGFVTLFGQYGKKRSQRGFWDQLLPNARQRLIDAGLFTAQGDLTVRGRQVLREGTWSSLLQP